MNLRRIFKFFFGLVILCMGLFNLIFTPINTLLSCDGAEGVCTANKQYFFYSLPPIRFNGADISQERISEGRRGKRKKDWTVRFNIPATNFEFVYTNEDAANKVLRDIEDFKSNPVGNSLYINPDNNFYHIWTNLLCMLGGIIFLWFSVMPSKGR